MISAAWPVERKPEDGDWEKAKTGCRCGRCSCMRLRQGQGQNEPPSPMTMAESWLLQGAWPADHRDGQPRMKFIRTFGFAILTGAAIRLIREYGPIIEVGAGTGYWTMELARAGIDILATDPTPGMYFEGSSLWTKVEMINGPEALEKHPGRNVLMCWPDREEWPSGVVSEFTGDHIIYVGEPRDGCTGNNQMFNILDRRYELETRLEIPQFHNIHDQLEVWRRRNP